MNLLVFEFSSPAASVAILSDGVCLATEQWRGARRGHHESVLDRLPGLLEQARLGLEDIDLYGVGRGPGHYAGMRIALTVAQALALPDETPVYAVSSGEALARTAARSHGATQVAVLGDARRAAFWYGLYDAGREASPTWRLAAADELAAALPEEALLVTSEWDRLEGLAAQPTLASRHWLREACFPEAQGVGRLILERLEGETASEPLTPLYMHPAV